jgi:hypothetical protein
MGILVGSINTINGIWVISGSEEQTVIQMCWVTSSNVSNNQLNYRSWIFLYLPIIFVYSYALYVLYCARLILQNGIPITFLHRSKVLYTAQVTVTIFLIYYILLALMSFLGSSVNVASSGAGIYIWICVIFLICAKAHPALVVFLIAQNCEYLIEENSKETGAGAHLLSPSSSRSASTPSASPVLGPVSGFPPLFLPPFPALLPNPSLLRKQQLQGHRSQQQHECQLIIPPSRSQRSSAT